jgi:hypothetical protein
MPLLIAALFFATALPVLVPENTPIVRGAIGPASGGNETAVASDGTNFLLVSGPLAMFVDRDGNPLLPASVTEAVHHRLMLRYALAPRPRPAKRR